MIKVDCRDAFYGEPFATGAIIDMGPKTYDVLLCVRRPRLRLMRLYVLPRS